MLVMVMVVIMMVLVSGGSDNTCLYFTTAINWKKLFC